MTINIEDAVQETIITAWTKIKTLKNAAYFKTWIIRILINHCNGLLRKQKRFVLTDEVKLSSEFYSDNSESYSIWDAINRLDKELSSVIVLYYFEDLTSSEIAYSLGIPEGTVKSRLSRAKSKLSKALKTE